MSRSLKITLSNFENKINKYFNDCDKNKKPYTLSGLALFLDIDRKTLLNYSKKDKFFPTIKKAKLRCEVYAEEKLFTSKNVAGVIFNLKNNYGWKNKDEVLTEFKESKTLTLDELPTDNELLEYLKWRNKTRN